ncbi:collagen alpha-1(XXIII) chain, partial [Biomphalaria glabrata]
MESNSQSERGDLLILNGREATVSETRPNVALIAGENFTTSSTVKNPDVNVQANTRKSRHKRDKVKSQDVMANYGSSSDTKVNPKENGLSPRPCSKILLWIFACFALTLVCLVTAFIVWTLVSYQSTISRLEARILRLEEAHEDYQHKIEAYVHRTVDEILVK